MSVHHYVYIVQCSDQTLYTGYTTDIDRRIKMHNQGKAAKYTRGRVPVELRYLEQGESMSWAIKREIEIKKYTREKKLRLIAQGGTGLR